MGSLLLALFVNCKWCTKYLLKETNLEEFSLHSQTSINIYLNVYKCVVYKSTMQFLFYNTHLQLFMHLLPFVQVLFSFVPVCPCILTPAHSLQLHASECNRV